MSQTAFKNSKGDVIHNIGNWFSRTVFFNDHTPENKRPCEVQATANLEVIRNTHRNDVIIELTETINYESGREITKVISVTLDAENREFLKGFLS